MTKIKLKDWAIQNGLSYITANRYFHAGLIPGAEQLGSGTILVEDDTSESSMLSNTSNDAMSLFLKKTVEFSKNNATVEDFAAYVISNFNLKMNTNPETPRYSRQKPKSEDVRKHFQQFIPKGEKPKPNSFVMEPDTLDDLQEVSKPIDSQELVQEFKQAIQTPNAVPAVFTSAAVFNDGGEAMSAESTVTRNVDFSTPQQQINYTGSNNSTFSGSFSPLPIDNAHVGALMSNSVFHVGTTTNTCALNHVLPTAANVGDDGLYFVDSTSVVDDSSLIGAFQPTQKELQSVKTAETQSFAPKRRGRKPIKR